MDAPVNAGPRVSRQDDLEFASERSCRLLSQSAGSITLLEAVGSVRGK